MQQTLDPGVRDLLYQLKFGSNAQRNEAIDSVALLGTKALPHLAALMGAWKTPGQFRGSQEAMRRIALNGYRQAGEAPEVSAELVKLTGESVPDKVRREAVSLLGFATDPAAADAVSALLSSSTMREDARMALERMRSRYAESALRSAMRDSAGEWKRALDYSLRKRRMTFKEIGTRKLSGP